MRSMPSTSNVFMALRIARMRPEHIFVRNAMRGAPIKINAAFPRHFFASLVETHEPDVAKASCPRPSRPMQQRYTSPTYWPGSLVVIVARHSVHLPA